MLCLSRRKDESVVIDCGGSRIVVQVLQIGYGHVRLGFVAPANVTVHREEVQERVDQETVSRQLLQAIANRPDEYR